MYEKESCLFKAVNNILKNKCKNIQSVHIECPLCSNSMSSDRHVVLSSKLVSPVEIPEVVAVNWKVSKVKARMNQEDVLESSMMF